MKKNIQSIIDSFTNADNILHWQILSEEYEANFIEFCEQIYFDKRSIFSFYSVKSHILNLKNPLLPLNKGIELNEKSIGNITPSIMQFFQVPKFTKVVLCKIEHKVPIDSDKHLHMMWFQQNRKYQFLILNFIK